MDYGLYRTLLYYSLAEQLNILRKHYSPQLFINGRMISLYGPLAIIIFIQVINTGNSILIFMT